MSPTLTLRHGQLQGDPRWRFEACPSRCQGGCGCVTDRGAALTQRGPDPPDAEARWLELRSHGPAAEQAARGVGHGRSNLYRWMQELEPKSRRPHRGRSKTWTRELVEAIVRFRNDNPMRGEEKITVLLA